MRTTDRRWPMRLADTVISVEQGDISLFGGDAVVNAANNHLVLGAGVAGAIRARGGPTIQAECDALIRRRGPIDVGEAVVTGGGNLQARFVIHAAAMGSEPVSETSIRSATAQALRLARELGLSSVAFPVLGSGVGGFSLEDSARLMIDEMRAHASAPTSLRSIVLYGFTPRQAAAIQRVLSELARDPDASPSTQS